MKKPDVPPALVKWWTEARENLSPDEILRFLINNKEKLEDSLNRLHGKKTIYNASEQVLAFFSRLADVADRLSMRVQFFLMRFSWFASFINNARTWKNHLNFRELIEFVRIKLYSLRRAPHNEKVLQALEEVVEFAASHGLDLNQHFPKIRQTLSEKKLQLLQHKFFQEFSKTRLEQLLAIPFAFDRSIFPVLPDTAFWHKFFEFAEKRNVMDIILVNADGRRFSFKKSRPEEIQATDTVRTLKILSTLKNQGRRIFFVGHHEGYLGPYFVRSVIRKLGFHLLAQNCNTIVGPRMFSNLVLRNGAANVGNLFLTVPSQKTTAIRTSGLAEELKKTARRTQCLIKLPEAGLYLIRKLSYDEFMKAAIDEPADALSRHMALMDDQTRMDFLHFLESEKFSEAMRDFSRKDYDLFKQIMKECFLIFPEGSRSYVDPDGSVVLKYINPKYLQAYMRPRDVIAPISLVGGADIARGWHLHRATLGISTGNPIDVTPEMLENYEEEGVSIMKNIARLPNIKTVRFKEHIQNRNIN